nr:hypothetical protein [Solirubrobacterales bacterium]
MVVVLTALGAFVYLRFEQDLDASLDRGQRSRAADIASLVQRPGARRAGGNRGPLIEGGESFAQVLDPNGKVIAGTPRLPHRSVLSAADLARARRGPLVRRGRGAIDPDEHTRFLARPFTAQGRRLVVVVGASLDDNEEALHNLRVLLL